ncbi:MAG: 1,4-dihydroxy-2-naphthoate octaprenyltransferase [bacterium]|nr:MAG: 1,4-dihydroxy-2-naphthoate octaprenyltransferase [bacterium]
MSEITTPSRTKLSIWLQTVRPFSFTASVTPVVVGAVLSLSFPGQVHWFLFPLIVVCSLLFHAGTNVVSEYYDFKHGVDRPHTYGSSKVLVEGLLTPREVLYGGIALFAAGFTLGLILVMYRGAPIFWLGVIGLLGGYFYTGKPVGYKYFALGDFLVFTLMGPLMVIGSYYALTGDYTPRVLYVSLPIGFLVAAILHANNLRDIVHDGEANVRTVANIVGLKNARVVYFMLVGAAYLSVVVMVAAGVVKPWALIVFLSVPPAIKNLKSIIGARLDNVGAIAMIDIQTAQHHFLFGLLLTVGIVLSAVL